MQLVRGKSLKKVDADIILLGVYYIAQYRRHLVYAQYPLRYKDLIVRIAGYSAYFVELSKDCQNDLIRRHDHSI